MKTIPLTQGKVALVDDEDYEWLSQWGWHACNYGHTYYAVRISPRKNGKQHRIRMHRAILKPPLGFEPDHKNGNGLDNRRNNLRIATRAQNGANRRKICGTSSKYKGVCWYKAYRKWMAHIKINGKQFYLGYFDSEEIAATAYDEAARKYFSEFARTNFEPSALVGPLLRRIDNERLVMS